MGQTFIASLLGDITTLIIDARSAVRMAVCSYCQRINAFRPVNAAFFARSQDQVVVIFFWWISCDPVRDF